MGCGSVVKALADRQARHAERRYPPAGSFLEVGSTRIHYLRKGNGQPLVLLHGNDGSLLDFSMSIFDELAQDFDVIAIDRPGHGHSELPNETLTVELQSWILRQVLTQLQVSKPILLAHSWSAILALQHAGEYAKDVKGLLLLAPVCYPDRRAFSILDMVDSPLRELVIPLMALAGRPAVAKALANAFSPDLPPAEYVEAFTALSLRPKQIKALSRDEVSATKSLRNLAAKYGHLQVPVVMLTGDEDRMVEARHHSCALHKELPNSQLILLHGAGHALHFTHPHEIVKAVHDLTKQNADKH